MAGRNTSSRAAATPGQLALVVVLAIVFAFVLWNEFFRGSSEATDRSETITETSVRASAAIELIATPANDQTQQLKHGDPPIVGSSRFDSKSVGTHDPFQMPTHWKTQKVEIDEPQIVEGEKQTIRDKEVIQPDVAALKALKKRGADMIIISDSQRLAIIGNETLKIGDVYEGLRVISIESNGLTVEKID